MCTEANSPYETNMRDLSVKLTGNRMLCYLLCALGNMGFLLGYVERSLYFFYLEIKLRVAITLSMDVFCGLRFGVRSALTSPSVRLFNETSYRTFDRSFSSDIGKHSIPFVL